MTLADAILGKEIPLAIRDSLALVAVKHMSYDGTPQVGHLVVHTNTAQEVIEIFDELFARSFPIEKIIPVATYDWDDNASMRANNTSAFNYRFIALTDRLSNHAYGRAIDINPMQNPCLQRDGSTVPEGASYDVGKPGTITPEIARIFTSRGWEWGGDWERKDWQHFERH